MKIRSVVVATLMICGSLVYASSQTTSAGTVCLVPPRTTASTISPQQAAYPAGMVPVTVYTAQGPVTMYYPASNFSSAYSPGTPMASCPSPSSMYPVYPTTGSMGSPCPAPGTSAMMYQPGMTQTSSMPTTGVSSFCSSNASPDTACIVNQIASLQGTIRSQAIELRGSMLINRMNQLMADELAFRQQLAANPNLPNAQLTAQKLQNEALSLNQDIAAFNSQLSMVPLNQRPYMAAELNTFDVAYWQPAMQRFAAYSSQFPQSASTYQTAMTANPWLQSWQATYQSSLNNIAMGPQTYAYARWWTGTQVLGSTEYYPSGTMGTPSTMGAPYGGGMNLPSGAAIYMPPSAIPSTGMGTTGVTGTAGATGTTGTGTTGTGAAGATGTTGTAPQSY